MGIVCDSCGKVLGDKQYELTVKERYKWKFYECCSEECLQKVLIREGIGIPEVPKAKKEKKDSYTR